MYENLTNYIEILSKSVYVSEEKIEKRFNFFSKTVSLNMNSEKNLHILQISDVPVAVHSAWVQTCDKNSLTAFIKFEHYESIHTIAPIKEFWVQYQIDSETEGSQWRTHPVPSAAHPNDKIDNNLRHTTGDATVSLQPFGKVSDYGFV